MQTVITAIKLALKEIRRNTFRTLLTMLGIIIGTASVILISSIGIGAESLLTNTIAKAGTRTVSVLPGKSDDSGPPAAAQGIITKTLTIEDAEAILKLPHVDSIAPMINTNASITYQNNTLESSFVGSSHQLLEVGELDLERGRFFTEEEVRTRKKVIVLGNTLYNELFDGMDGINKEVLVNNMKMKVIGYNAKKGGQAFGNPDEEAYIPYSIAQKEMLNIDYLHWLRIRADSEDTVNFVKSATEELLQYRHNIKNKEDNDFSVRTIASALGMVTGITGAVRAFLTAISAISLIVGGIGIMNIMLMNIKKRTREIGLRKALGATPRAIQLQFLIESMVITLTGGIIGMLLGLLLSYVISVIVQYLDYDWTFSITIESIFIGVFVGIFIGVVFGYGPSKTASQMNAIEALRME